MKIKIKLCIELVVFLAGGGIACIASRVERNDLVFFGLLLMIVPVFTFIIFKSRDKLYFDFFKAEAPMPAFGGDGESCTTCHEKFTKWNPHNGFGICEKCFNLERDRLVERTWAAKHGGPK